MIPLALSPIVRSVLLTATLVAASAMAAPARALEPFAADYQASYMGLSANGRMTIESQGGNQWKYTLKISNQVAQLTQTTVFEDRDGQWRPLTGTDASLLLVKKIRRNAVYDWAKGEARWSGDVKPERAGPVPLQTGDVDGLLMNLAIARDAVAGKPLRYRMVDEGRAKPMSFTVAGKESIIIGGKPRQATKLVSSNGNKQMLIWVVEGLALPARILQRKDGKDDIDLKIVSVQ
ncbi:MAG: DUF3108 domain-containing protein [Xanthomonadales bacterium]|nr:DUF3108 domain-containing protein [Xanthomonadales bacterium]